MEYLYDTQLSTGKNEVVRAVQMQVGTNFLVQQIKLLYSLKFHCDVPPREGKEQKKTNLNPDSKKFCPRRNAATIADARIQEVNATIDDERDI